MRLKLILVCLILAGPVVGAAEPSQPRNNGQFCAPMNHEARLLVAAQNVLSARAALARLPLLDNDRSYHQAALEKSQSDFQRDLSALLKLKRIFPSIRDLNWYNDGFASRVKRQFFDWENLMLAILNDVQFIRAAEWDPNCF